MAGPTQVSGMHAPWLVDCSSGSHASINRNCNISHRVCVHKLMQPRPRAVHLLQCEFRQYSLCGCSRQRRILRLRAMCCNAGAEAAAWQQQQR